MNRQEYQKLCLRTAKPMGHQAAIEHGVLGIVSDWGEVVTHIKALVVYGKPISRKELMLELGDTSWFVAYTFDVLGINVDHVDTHASPGYPPGTPAALTQIALLGAKHAGKIADIVSATPETPEELYPNIAFHLSMMWHCIFHIAIMNGLTIDEVWEANIAKLRARYPEKYTDADAIARADEVLSSGSMGSDAAKTLNMAAEARAQGTDPY